jgi:hypothetical protein
MKTIIWIQLLLLCAVRSHAQLAVTVSPPKAVGQKALIKLTMKNRFNDPVESARAQVFLFDEMGKMVGQSAKWVIGGTKDKPGLAPDAEAVFNFVVNAGRPFKTASVSFNRVILRGGKLADVIKDVSVVPDGK